MKRILAMLLAALTAILTAAFVGCAQHTHIVISTDSIGDFYCSFYEDGTLEVIKYIGEESVVRVPSFINDRKVVGISTWAFKDEATVTEVYLPASLKKLPAKLFDSCPNLKSIYIPASVSSIGNDLVTLCPSFTSVFFGGTEQQWNSIAKGTLLIDNFSLSQAEMHYEYVVAEEEVHTHVAVSAENIGDYYCSIFEDNTIEIIKYIGNEAVVRIPSSLNAMKVVGISTWAFKETETVETVYLPSTIRQLPTKLFDSCPNLKTIYIPVNVRAIGNDLVVSCPRFRIVCYGGTEEQWESVSKGNILTDNYQLSHAEYKFEYVLEDGDL